MAIQLQNFVQWGLAKAAEGDWHAAQHSYDQALWINPRYVDAYMARGMNYLQKGDFDQALADFNQVLQLEPMLSAGYYNRGCTYYAQQQVELSLDDFRQAISLDSQFLPAHQKLVEVLNSTGRYPEAILAYRDWLSIVGESAEIYHNLAIAYRHSGQLSEAAQCFQIALKIDPEYIPAREEMLLLYRENIQSWHYWMMNDTARNLPYQEAIARYVTSETLVLEIGTGSGLLAMMAAKAGAKQVITCESEDLIAAQAKQIIKTNGYQVQIQVINKLSHDLVIPHDLPEPADILITEIFGAWLPSEGAFDAITHATKHLLKPNAKVIPSGANLYLMAIECSELHQRYWVDQSLGFDLTGFNEFQYPRPAFMGQIDQHIYRPLSDSYCFAQLDFGSGQMKLTDQVVDVPVVADGRLHGVCTWFDLLIDDTVMLTTGPLGDVGRRSRSWGQLTAMIFPSLCVKNDEILKLQLLPSLNMVEVIAQIQT
ncbi:tetratricopeptide repeat protein [Pseudanabaena mucicola]|uniref:tetratricopeptide repeat protein n=1 Tax=Pseudanabaena mucicola TaxID=71190 RepID=UPI002576188E|nr:tetratricopeptide repeat protein [Pseudanabaena mucicola]